MGYAYAGMWFLVGLILIFALGKENKIFYFAGGFFLLLGGWWLADTLLPEQSLFAGAWGWGFRIVAGAALVIFFLCFLRERKKSMENSEGSDKDGKK